MRITSKAQFFWMWERDLLGNHPKLFHTVEDALDYGCADIGFREIGKSGGGAWERVPRCRARETAELWAFAGRKFIMDETCPNVHSTLQGEVCRTFRGLEGYMGLSKGLAMRPAIKAGLMLPRTGATILALFEKYMDPSSQDDIWQLLDLYQDATIEFTCFDIDLGVLPGRNTLIWETRVY